ncbi:hypothetical protein Ae168Ps1_6352c [Pseudonocardia sp. Ae168_Ps1]|uniref:hypothetical protein n=1 Tax=unclassified Pseudonocardia TaxID=2619320 RepID=UPI00094AAB0B|nr:MULTISPECIES: hypothetical protein [unclassified Pseudonocardia]OLL69905.1 hypothetical protein Ae150APs1_6215 [Pseudonocardia sp. Ae150A_Ps1]OLL70115.1 hypothetical protein Ae168Ps1_6352c [Pseudonocardia sp. Ae168_Ps1]OLL70386.1 hypothetical protein Ae263Ps1_6330c [Pseudonocardia sp. Ae263_Ps1]OLL89167.1 hypothetical protein Ae356Ps1_6195c [Pseudonocardia sp. Ae356_Ps1]
MTTHYLAQGLNTNGLMDWLAQNIVPVAVIGIGLVAVAAAAKSDIAKIVSMIVCVMVALVVVGIGLIDGAPQGVAEWAGRLLTGGNGN